MKKKVVLSGGLKEMVTYCTAIYELEKDVDTEYLTNIISKSPIFENKSFYNIRPRYGRWTNIEDEIELEKAFEQISKDEEVFQILQFPFVNFKDRYMGNEIVGKLDMGLKPYESCKKRTCVR